MSINHEKSRFLHSAGSGLNFFLNPRLAVNADILVPYYLDLGLGYSGILGVKLKL